MKTKIFIIIIMLVGVSVYLGLSRMSHEKIGDINKDGRVDEKDYSLMMSDWDKTGVCRSDLNEDRIVDILDFNILMIHWDGEIDVPVSLFFQREPTQMAIMGENALIPISEPAYLKKELLGHRTITAYSSTIDQTDSTPFITADGTRVKKGIVATNELPFGQRLIIEGIEGIFVVADRTNKKYNFRMDIWMPTREEAMQFGKQIKKITLIN